MNSQFYKLQPADKAEATLSRRSFVKAAVGATLLAGVSAETLMAETKEGVPRRALGRTGEKVSAIGLGGYHIGKQADENESISIIRKAIDRGTIWAVDFAVGCRHCPPSVSQFRGICMPH